MTNVDGIIEVHSKTAYAFSPVIVQVRRGPPAMANGLIFPHVVPLCGHDARALDSVCGLCGFHKSPGIDGVGDKGGGDWHSTAVTGHFVLPGEA